MKKGIVIKVWKGMVEGVYGLDEEEVEVHILDWDLDSRDMLIKAGVDQSRADQMIKNNEDILDAIEQLYREWNV